MLRLFVGVFLGLHGAVHLLFMGQSSRIFELSDGLVWPDGSWAFSGKLGDTMIRRFASVACAAAAVGFLSGSLGTFLRQPWWRSVVFGAAAFSTLLFLLFWDGTWSRLADQGGVGVLINLALLASVLVLKWTDFRF